MSQSIESWIKVMLFMAVVTLLPSILYSQNLDVDILRSINTEHPSGYWIQTTNSAYWAPAVLSAGVVTYALVHRDQSTKINAYQTVFSIGIGLGLSETIKLIVNRTRPGDQYPGVIFPYDIVHGHSFPSGHTTSAFLLAATILFQYNKIWYTLPAYIWAATVGYSRMKLGEHFPTDVLGGMITGTGGALLSRLAVKKWIK